jgi:xanthine/uracil/vitamin C permease (AzgA family)
MILAAFKRARAAYEKLTTELADRLPRSAVRGHRATSGVAISRAHVIRALGVTLGAITSSPTTRSSLYTEIVGGVTTFVTMAYIIVVNPGILSTPGTGMTFSGALTATVLVAFSMTLLMGLYAKLPFAVAPGMDALPAFVTIVLIPLTLSITQGILWGFVLHALLYAAAGRAREVSPALWALGVLSAGLLVLER